MEQEWNTVLSKISGLIDELEKEDILRDVKRIKIANDLIERHKGNPEKGRKVELARDAYEESLTEKLQANLLRFQELFKEKENLDLKKSQLETEKETLEGQIMIEVELATETATEEKASELRKKAQEIETRQNELNAIITKADLAIGAFSERALLLSHLPSELCKALRHPRKEKRQVKGKRDDDVIDRLYCPDCERFVDDEI